jgi:DNA-directed RNA polymerase subunit RPC12/RpoP
MFMNVTCPMCGHKWRVPERAMGQQVSCPACSKSFQCSAVAPPSLTTPPTPAQQPPAPVQAMPQARAVQVQPDQSIHYRCPRCAKPLESPVAMAGQKVNCTDCGQRLQIPQAATPSPINRTILANEETAPKVTPQVPASSPLPPSPAPVQAELIPAAVPAPAPGIAARRESCLECGADITGRPRVQTCPDCGSLFCSARCYRDHSYYAHPSRRR